jgi:hypothetical protein
MLTATSLSVAQSVDVQGFVRTVDGEPIDKVYILGSGNFANSTTDEKGFFRSSSSTPISSVNSFVFHKIGFIPKIVPIESSSTNLNVVLEPEGDGKIWEVQACNPAGLKQGKVIGKFLKLRIPKNLKVESGVDDDYVYYAIGFKRDEKRHWLNGGLGNLFGSLYPFADLRSDLKEYSYRRTSVGMDWRGTTKNGKFWRHFGAVAVFETYYYITGSKEAADAFDQIIDGVCFQGIE